MNKLILLLFAATLSIHAQDSTSVEITPPAVPEPLPQPLRTVPLEEVMATGSLHILTNSSEGKIYLDGKEVGVSECLINNIPIGAHEVFILDGDNSSTIPAYVIEGVTRTIKANPGRETFVSVMSTFSNVWCRGIRAYGPSLDIGIQHHASYYGINFHWGFFNDGNYYIDSRGREHEESGEFAGGAALQWYYTIYKYKEYLEIAPGLASGFWSFHGNKSVYGSGYSYETSYYDEYNDGYFTEMFFTGPSLRLSIGFKRVFMTSAYTLLIGTRLAHVLVFGTRVVL